MQLLKFYVKNWQIFSDITLECRDFLIFTGASSSGKSSLMKALMYFFDIRNLHAGDIKDNYKPLELIADLKFSHKEYFRLKIFKFDGEENKYFINKNPERKSNREWQEISYKEYKKYILNINIFYIPAVVETSQLNYLLEKLFKIEKLQKYIKYLKKFEEANKNKMSSGYYKYIFIDLLKEIALKEANTYFWKNCILLWEKPEFYLNPQEERACYDMLQENTKLGLNAVVSTNSSRFIELEKYKSLCIFRKVENEVEIYQYSGNLFSGDEVSVFNMNYWINPDRSELFFAKKVILVEGQTDKIVLSYLAKKLNIFRYDYSIIECGSKSSIPQFIRLLNAFKIPYIAVYDKDNHYWRNETEILNSNLKNKTIQNMIYKKIGTYVEFENDIEEEIYSEPRDRKNYKNKPFYALEKIMDINYEIPKRLKEKILQIFN